MSTGPPILYVDDIHLTHGVTPLLDGASLSVGRDDRICLVGRNGSGKSTLLKIIAGQIEADSGERFVQPGIHVEYLAQDPDFKGFPKAEDFILQGLMNNEDRQRAFQLMADLRINGAADIAPMSGGERRRVALAKAMACQPEVLLLDEPTNHLDLPAIEWLERALRQINSALVLVSHDRCFLSNMANQTVWLDRGKTKLMRKNFGHFEDWRDGELEREAQAQHKLDRKIAREEDWLRYGVTARRKRNVRRLGELHNLRQARRDYRGPQGDIDTVLQAGDRSGKLVVKADKIAKAYGDKKLIDNFSTQIKRGSRIGLIGPNGAGKTTLLNILLGALTPDSGNVRLGKNLTPLILDQQRQGIKQDWNVKDALTDGAGDLVSIGNDTMHVIGYMKNFLFHPAQMRTPVTVLSGGEQARLFLARGLRQSSNLLVMDEPTNDLDLETLDLLQEMISAYDGTVILVSHDRDFLDRTVTSVFNAEGEGRWVEYAGGYSDMRAQQNGQGHRADQAHRVLISKSTTDVQGKRKSSVGKKLSYKHQFRLEKLPKEMEFFELAITEIEDQLTQPDLYSKDPKRFNQLAARLEEAKNNLKKAEEEWLDLEAIREELESEELKGED